MPEIQASFLHPFSYSSPRRRWTQFWRTIFAALGPCQSPTPSRQPLFETSDTQNQMENRQTLGSGLMPRTEGRSADLPQSALERAQKVFVDIGTEVSDFSSRPWRNLPPWVFHMATRRPAQNTPIHMDFLHGFSFKKHQVHVDRRVVGWSASRHVDHPCGGANFAMAC